MRITYAATLTADAKLGDTDNPNEVVLTWKRTNTGYYGTLQDCCHVYTYGVDVLKQFSDGKGDLTNVSFLLHNDTDDVYIIAEQRNGMYYVKGFTDKKADATTLVPNDSGHIIVNGLEDDTYTVTITSLWETLTYAVVDMKIIQPDQVDKIKIQPGRDLLTLITCHPYASGGRQRLVVYCERVRQVPCQNVSQFETD